MAVDNKNDLQQICESIINYQNDLVEIDKYIGRINSFVEELEDKLVEQKIKDTLGYYQKRLEAIKTAGEQINQAFEEITAGNAGMYKQLDKISKFEYSVNRFETMMKDYKTRADSLSQKLYNKDWNNAVKTMQSIAEEGKNSTTYEYRHVTNHDYDILMHEYSKSLAGCREKRKVNAFIEAAKQVLHDTKLRHSEYEALQRLIEKLVHSDSQALEKFINEVKGMNNKNEKNS